ncbi:phosphatidate cytidylyltransferase [Gallaecimonas xiamenensis]|uniref:Phosphatidate cytidylyltransferase n=1 Tax=Gallaecimonas xiamenensis 3-C-1 TaxID=745411 RepID=K2IGL8_9GAMM|nr:phosphatidate cytidylyltransferase [Gallaecimonas xiamenensis]EKE69206.1 CDP-diglyceride synthetase [Gallaecimonas xiamenensis 3-C-1]
MLKQRIITALLLLPVALLVIFWLPLDAFGWVAAVLIAIGGWEWAPLAGLKGRFYQGLLATITFAILALVQYVVPVSALWAGGQPAGFYSLMVLLAGFWWTVAAVLITQYPEPTRFWQQHKRWRLIFGALTLLPTWAGLVVLRSWRYQEDPLFGAWAILFVLLLVWAADTGAYFAGRTFGKHKLSPKVSPNKTLEGAAGGLLLAMAICAACLYLRPASISASAIVVASALTVLASILGDLSESMFKREAGIKDSGSILPGHGGILDRIDSITAAAPIFVLVMLAMGV